MKRKMIHKTFKQLNAERAARRARPSKKIERLGEITRGHKPPSSQAGGPAPKGSGFKQLKLTSDKLIRYYRTHK